MFARNTAATLSLRPGCKLRLFAPWTVMSMPLLARPVLTCTHFAEAVVEAGVGGGAGAGVGAAPSTGGRLASASGAAGQQVFSQQGAATNPHPHHS